MMMTELGMYCLWGGGCRT